MRWTSAVLPLPLLVLLACNRGKVCDPKPLSEPFASLRGFTEVAAKTVVCKSDERHLELQDPDATGDDAWIQKSASIKEALAAAGWTPCAEHSAADIQMRHMAFLQKNDGIVVSVAGRTSGVVWRGTVVRVSYWHGDGSRENRDLVRRMSCEHVQAMK